MANPAFAQSFHIATTSTILDDSMTWLAHSDLAIAGVHLSGWIRAEFWYIWEMNILLPGERAKSLAIRPMHHQCCRSFDVLFVTCHMCGAV